MKRGPETIIQLSICDYLAYKKYFFWRSNNVPIYNKNLNRFRAMPKYSINGIPDIILIKDGKFIGLEVKTPKGRQSENQKIFQSKLEKVGGEYYLVTSIDDIIKLGL